MSSSNRSLYPICLRSAWPTVFIMLTWALIIVGPLLGRGLLYPLPLLVVGFCALCRPKMFKKNKNRYSMLF